MTARGVPGIEAERAAFRAADNCNAYLREHSLRTDEAVAAALDVLDAATALVAVAEDRRSVPVRLLRQALGHAWSVVIAADVGHGLTRFVALAEAHPDDADLRWIVRENLKKHRLKRLGLTLP